MKPNERTDLEMREEANSREGAPPQLLAAIDEWDAQLAREGLAPERDRELEVESHYV